MKFGYDTIDSKDEEEEDNQLLLSIQRRLEALPYHKDGEVGMKLGYSTIDSNDEEEDDDDQLLLSIQRKLQALPSQKLQTDTQSSESEEEDDDQILRSVEKMYCHSLHNAYASHQRSDNGKGHLGNGHEFANADDFRSPRTSLPRVDEEIMQAGSDSKKVAASHDISVHSIERLGHESNFDENERLRVSDLPGLPSQFDAGEQTGSLGNERISIIPERSNTRRFIKKASSSSNEAAAPFKDSPGLFGLPGQFEEDFDEIFGAVSKDIPSVSDPSNENLKVQVALAKNRQCQNILQKLLLQVEQKQKDNKELQRRMRTLTAFEKCCRRRFAGRLSNHMNPSLQLIRVPKLGKCGVAPPAESNFLGPPNNKDVETFQKLQREFPAAFDLGKWSKQESEELKKGVTQQLQENLVRETMEALVANQGPDVHSKNLDDLLQEVAKRSFTAEEIRKHLPSINWGQLARRYVADRSAAECKIRWLNHEDCLTNNSPWTKAEDKRLLHFAQQHDLCDWEAIAQQLNTNRTPAQCLIRYQRSLNATIMRSSWTPEEDEQLRMAVHIHGDKNWQAVAANIEGRTGSQCSNRWHKVVLPGRRSGRWELEEDKRLIYAVSLYDSKQWNKIASHVPGRTDVQCRERWCNVLDPSLKREDWSVGEDKQLEEAVAKYGAHHWAAVANELKPRTDNQCWRRWRLLNPEHQAAFQKDLRIRRVALVPNFVGRKKERPSLGISDFISEDNPDEIECRPKNKANKTRRKPKESQHEVSDMVVMPTSPEHHEYSGVSAKVWRQARMEKMRLARALGRLKRFSKKDGEDEGALSTLVSFRTLHPPQAITKANTTGQRTSLSTLNEGIFPFVSMVRSLASFCQLQNGPDVNAENEGGKAGWVIAQDPAVRCRSMSVQVNEKAECRQESPSEGKEMPLTKQSKDEEVAAAARAVLSWPFFYGLQRFWTRGWDSQILQDPENRETDIYHPSHSSSNMLQFRNKRKRSSHNKPRLKRAMAPEKPVKDGEASVLVPTENSIKVLPSLEKFSEPTKGTSTGANEHRFRKEQISNLALSFEPHCHIENAANSSAISQPNHKLNPIVCVDEENGRGTSVGSAPAVEALTSHAHIDQENASGTPAGHETAIQTCNLIEQVEHISAVGDSALLEPFQAINSEVYVENATDHAAGSESHIQASSSNAQFNHEHTAGCSAISEPILALHFEAPADHESATANALTSESPIHTSLSSSLANHEMTAGDFGISKPVLELCSDAHVDHENAGCTSGKCLIQNKEDFCILSALPKKRKTHDFMDTRNVASKVN